MKRGAPHHRALFFLTNEKDFSRLEIVPDGGISYDFRETNKARKRIKGRRSPDNPGKIVVKLRDGEEILINPDTFEMRHVVGNSRRTELTFDLGKLFK